MKFSIIRPIQHISLEGKIEHFSCKVNNFIMCPPNFCIFVLIIPYFQSPGWELATLSAHKIIELKAEKIEIKVTKSMTSDNTCNSEVSATYIYAHFWFRPKLRNGDENLSRIVSVQPRWNWIQVT